MSCLSHVPAGEVQVLVEKLPVAVLLCGPASIPHRPGRAAGTCVKCHGVSIRVSKSRLLGLGDIMTPKLTGNIEVWSVPHCPGNAFAAMRSSP